MYSSTEDCAAGHPKPLLCECEPTKPSVECGTISSLGLSSALDRQDSPVIVGHGLTSCSSTETMRTLFPLRARTTRARPISTVAQASSFVPFTVKRDKMLIISNYCDGLMEWRIEERPGDEVYGRKIYNHEWNCTRRLDCLLRRTHVRRGISLSRPRGFRRLYLSLSLASFLPFGTRPPPPIKTACVARLSVCLTHLRGRGENATEKKERAEWKTEVGEKRIRQLLS